jgi:hypothetical protein
MHVQQWACILRWWYNRIMKTENIVALSFVLGAISGIGIFVWIVFYPLPSWSNDSRFSNFSKDCIISDIGAEYQVYCPQ